MRVDDLTKDLLFYRIMGVATMAGASRW